MQTNITLTNDDDFIFIAHFITYTLNVLNTENGDVQVYNAGKTQSRTNQHLLTLACVNKKALRVLIKCFTTVNRCRK